MIMSEPVDIEITKAGNVGIVAFNATSISDVEGIASSSKQIKDFIEDGRPEKIVCDFERVKLFSSQVLGLLLETRAKLEAYNGEVVISGINPQLHRVFKITNLDKIFKFFPDTERAVNASETD